MKRTQSAQKLERQNIRTIVTPPRKTVAVDVNGRVFECRTLSAVKTVIFNDIIAAFAPAIEAMPFQTLARGEMDKLTDEQIEAMMKPLLRVSLGLFYAHAEHFAKFVAACTGAEYAEIADLGADELVALTDACLEANDSLFFAPEIRGVLQMFNAGSLSESTTSLNDSAPTDGE